MSGRAANFYATGLAILKAGMSWFDEEYIFYWTDSVTCKGTKVYVESEAEREEILQLSVKKKI
jgi:hypothetical protein